MKNIMTKKIHPSIRELLSFTTSDLRVDKEYEKYLAIPNRKLYAYELQDRIVGCVGIEIVSSNECIIKHIAVSLEHRGQGIGSKMIQFISEQYPFISAETDKDAVDFYRKYGFAIMSLGEKYPGVERFLCEYEG